MGDHDTFFKHVFSIPEHAAGELCSVLPAAVTERMDLEALELVPASFIDDEMQHRHADLLFRAPLDDKTAYVYFLLEHQSEPDPLMPFRILTYMQRIWDRALKQESERRSLPIILPLVVHHGRRGWTAPMRLHEIIEGLAEFPKLETFLPDFRLLIDDLVHLDDAALLARPLEPFPKAALWALRDARSGEALIASLEALALELERVVHDDREQRDMTFLLRYIFRVAEDLPFNTLRQKLIELTPSVEASMASFEAQLIQQGVEQGVERGIKQGVELGRHQGVRDVLANQLRLRFGSLDPATRARVMSGGADELDRWLERVLTAESLAAVFDV